MVVEEFKCGQQVVYKDEVCFVTHAYISQFVTGDYIIKYRVVSENGNVYMALENELVGVE